VEAATGVLLTPATQRSARQFRQARPPQRLHLDQFRWGNAAGLVVTAIGTEISSRDTRPGIPSAWWWRHVHLRSRNRPFNLASGIGAWREVSIRWFARSLMPRRMSGRHARWLWSSVKSLKSGPQVLQDVEAGTLKPQYQGSSGRPLYLRSFAAAPRSARSASLSHHHKREPQPAAATRLRVLLPVHRGFGYRTSVATWSKLQPRSSPDGQPYCGVHRQQPRLASGYLRGTLSPSAFR